MASAGVKFFLYLIVVRLYLVNTSPSPYLSAVTLFQDFQSMLTTFKIFIYPPLKSSAPVSFPEPAASLFYHSLINSSFVTLEPAQAHLFFVSFSTDTTPRSLGRLIRNLRNDHPYWNRTLGADHFFLSPAGIDFSSDRNVLELKKNAVQLSVFPVTSGNFVPHKDVTLPPLNPSPLLLEQENQMTAESFLGYLKWDGKTEPNLIRDMKTHPEFLVEESESLTHLHDVKRSKFCLFLYNGDVWGLEETMSSGCVPVVIVNRPIQDLPFMDVLKWSDMSLLVRVEQGVERLKEVLNGISQEKYEEMSQLGVAASKHLSWNDKTHPLDVFDLVMYQLWLRRHVIRYARREFAL